MVLSDRTIKEEIAKGRLIIEPYDPDCVQPASVDVHLDNKLLVFREWQPPFYIDLRQPLDGLTEEVEVKNHEYFALQPGTFVLGSTREYIAVPDDIVAHLEGKSSLGRVGLLIHSTAGYVDPGWQGHLTLELSNMSRLPILLYPGMKICQISFYCLTSPAERPYGSPELRSKYQGQTGPIPTKYFQEFDKASLLSLPSIPVRPSESKDTKTEARRRNDALWEWLKKSEFRGNVRLFSEALNVKLKTVEDWFYRGAEPSEPNKLKIFRLTQLPQFRPKIGTEKKFPLLEESEEKR